jgi:hypothetical protein
MHLPLDDAFFTLGKREGEKGWEANGFVHGQAGS